MSTATGDRYRACPPGLRRGIDVARMYPEIRAIVVSKFAGVDVDDLVQETCAAICVKNTSERSAFDPERSSFARYVYLVAASKLGHMLGSKARREHRVLAVEAEALESVAADAADGAAAPVEVTPRTIGQIAEHISALARRARAEARHQRGRDVVQAARYEGLADAFHATAELLGEAFADDAPPIAQRVTAVLAIVDRPLTPGQLSAAVLAPVSRVERAIEQLGAKVVRRGGGAVELAPLVFDELPASRSRRTRRAPASSSSSTTRPTLWASRSSHATITINGKAFEVERIAVEEPPAQSSGADVYEAQRKWAEEQVAKTLLGAPSAPLHGYPAGDTAGITAPQTPSQAELTPASSPAPDSSPRRTFSRRFAVFALELGQPTPSAVFVAPCGRPRPASAVRLLRSA